MICVRPVYTSKLLGGLDDSNCLDGDPVPEPFTFAVYDTRDEDVTPHTVSLGGLDHGIIGIGPLILSEKSVFFRIRMILKRTLPATS